MKIKRLLSQILANRKNRLLYIVDASWEIFILLFLFGLYCKTGKLVLRKRSVEIEISHLFSSVLLNSA